MVDIDRSRSYPIFPVVFGVRFCLIPGADGYVAGSDGTVWSCRTKGGSKLRYSLCWHRLRPAISRQGYRKVRIEIGGRKRFVKVSRLILFSFVGFCPPEMEACHNNGKRRDDRLENLRWDSQFSNTMDRERHRHQRRYRRLMAKLRGRETTIRRLLSEQKG